MGENDSPGRLFQNGILLGLLRHYGFLLWALDTIYEMDKMGRLQLSGQGICFTDRVLLYISDKIGHSERASGFCSFFLLFSLFNEDMRNAAQPWGRNAGQKKKRENILQGR